MEVLLGAGGGLVAVFQHLFPVALVDGVAGLAGGGGSATFLRGFLAESWWLRKLAKSAQFDKIETLQDRF